MRGVNRLFWDIETSPNVGFFWRSGYKLNIPADNIIKERAIICICYKFAGAKKVHALTWDNGCDKKLLEDFSKVIASADELVAHNGDRFDLKWLNTRFLYHGLDPKPIERTVDTLKMAKQRFLFNSNRLNYISEFLQLGGKLDTSYDLWTKIVLDGCETSMKKMVKYCKHDVALLEKVYDKLSDYCVPKTHVGVLTGLDRWSCPHCASENVARDKKRVTATGMIRHSMECNDCKKFYTISDKVYRDYLKWIYADK